MYKTNYYKVFSIILISFSIISFFFGFYHDENSAGAGLYTGDFKLIWNNLQIYINNDFLSAINDENYSDSRTPIAYLIHNLFNPFIESKINFRRSVFFISLLSPIIFFL